MCVYTGNLDVDKIQYYFEIKKHIFVFVFFQTGM